MNRLASAHRSAASARPRPGGGHCRLWDRTARSARTAPATAPPVPSRPEIPPAASSWRSVQTPPPPASSASSPPTYARQFHPAADYITITGRWLLQRLLKDDVGTDVVRSLSHKQRGQPNGIPRRKRELSAETGGRHIFSNIC